MKREMMEGLFGRIDAAFNLAREKSLALDPDDPKSFHALRIAFKKFRYAIEFMEPFLPFVNNRFLEKLRKYQTGLGDIQDSQAMLERLADCRKLMPGHERELDALESQLTKKRVSDIQTFLEKAGSLAKFWPGAGAVALSVVELKDSKTGNNRGKSTV